MRALTYGMGDGPAIVDREDPKPEEGEALVRIEASAICGSERHSMVDGLDGNTGHEAAGVIVDPGSSGLRVGNRVGLTAIIGCGRCERCLKGQELHCTDRPVYRSPMWHAELTAVPVSALRPLPAGTDPVTAALATGDALGVPGRVFRRYPTTAGQRVLVLGLGPVGAGHTLVQAFAGAEVWVVEPSEYRRDLAIRLGARLAVPPGGELPRKPEVVIECSGVPASIRYALDVVDNGGIVIQSGECDTEIPIHPSETVIRREVTYTGSWYYGNEDFPTMLGLVEKGLPIRDLVTHEVPMIDAPAAVGEFLAGRTGKVVIRWN